MHIDANVSEIYFAPSFMTEVHLDPEDGSSWLLKNVCAYLPDYTASSPRIPDS